jgi:D-alanyl-D-alanine carboxypeptidase
MRRRWTAPLALFLLAVILHPERAATEVPGGQAAATDLAGIDRIIGDALAARAMPGASVAILFDDGRSISRQFGAASLEGQVAVTAGTRFRIGSISKLVTALAILKLVEEGRLDLDAAIATLLPDRPEIARLPASVTVRHLLNHTSGLPDYTRSELEAKVARGVSTDQDHQSVLRRPARSAPGSEWAYADLPFRTLSHLVERISGLPYGRYVPERLAPTLGVPSLALCEPGASGHAAGYLARNRAFEPEPAYAIRGLLGEGGLCATAEDLAKLLRGVAAGRWISAGSLAAMSAPTRLSGGQLIDYGLGVRGGWLGRMRAWGHTGGGLHGSWASVAYYPERGMSVAVVANGTGSDTDAATLQAAVAARLLGDRPAVRRLVPARFAAAVAGDYRRGDAITCIQRTWSGLSRVRPTSTAPPTELLHQGAGHFVRGDFPLDRIVFQVEDGRALGYSVYYDGFFAEYWTRASGTHC